MPKLPALALLFSTQVVKHGVSSKRTYSVSFILYIVFSSSLTLALDGQKVVIGLFRK